MLIQKMYILTIVILNKDKDGTLLYAKIFREITICGKLKSTLLEMLQKVVQKSKKINYCHFLRRHCQYHETLDYLKDQLIHISKEDAYQLLFKEAISHYKIAQFIYVIIYTTFPKELIGNRNMRNLKKSMPLIRNQPIRVNE